MQLNPALLRETPLGLSGLQANWLVCMITLPNHHRNLPRLLLSVFSRVQTRSS